MNNTIKSLIIILLLSFTSKIFTQELVITIPEQFSINDLPLPPFPLEVINKMDEEIYDIGLLDDSIVREISLNEIEYIYYPEFLEFKISNKVYLSHNVILESDITNIKSSYLSNFSNNNYLLTTGLGFNTDDNSIDLVLEYNEFRLPIDLSVEGSLEDNDIFFSFGDENYFSTWMLTQGIDDNDLFIEGTFKNDISLKPFFDIGFKDINQYYISSALGWPLFRGGISVVSNDLYPFIEIEKKVNKFIYRFETTADYEYIDYNLSATYINSNIISIGIGSTLEDNYNSIEPYIYLEENFLFGNREYKFSIDDINIEFDFINDYLTSIISINYIYDSSEITFDLLFNFKVGKL